MGYRAADFRIIAQERNSAFAYRATLAIARVREMPAGSPHVHRGSIRERFQLADHDSGVVYVFHGPADRIPWRKLSAQLRAELGGSAVLEILITSKVSGGRPKAAQSDRVLPDTDGRRGITARGSAIARQPTITDVARAAGVSITTVSRVLNGTQEVSQEARDRIVEAIAGLKYKPNESARTMARSKTTAKDKEHGLNGSFGARPS